MSAGRFSATIEAMMSATHNRRIELQGTTLRRLLRRGARGKIAKMLGKLHTEDVAVMMRDFTPSEELGVFRILISEFPQMASDVIIALDPQERHSLLQATSPDQVAKLLELAAVDDAVFLLDALPPDLKEQVLKIVDLEERFSEVQERLTYEDETAGRIMDSDFVAMSEDQTVSEAIAHVRSIAGEVDMISYLYVTDHLEHLLGIVSLRQLLLSSPDSTLGEIMNSSPIKVHIDTDQEEVAQQAARYDLLAIPVIDDDGRLAGIVTVDDIIDVFKEEANEDFYKMAGTSEDEMVYQDRSFKVAGFRLPWLLFNLGGGLIAGYFTTRFQETFQLAVMVGFVPVIMGMAGNVGSQTTTISVRGLATGRVTPGQGRIRTYLWQQFKVGLLLGIVCSLIVAGAALAYAQNPAIAIVIGLSLFVAVQLASFNGVMIPVLFQRLDFDPAVASGPLVTTFNDIFGILVYFSLATALLEMLGKIPFPF